MRSLSRSAIALALIPLVALSVWHALSRDSGSLGVVSSPAAASRPNAANAANAERLDPELALQADMELVAPALAAQPRAEEATSSAASRRSSAVVAEGAFTVHVLAADGGASASNVEVKLVRLDLRADVSTVALTQHATVVREARTDAQGRAVFDELVALVEKRHDETRELQALADGQAWLWVVFANVPGAELVRANLTPELLAAREVELRLPPTGRIRVQILGPDGEPLPEQLPSSEFEVLLGLVDPEEVTSPLLAFERPEWRQTTHTGSLVFQWVALGRSFEARAKRVGTDVFSRSEPGGPVVAGEEVELRVQIGKDHPVLAFRAVTEYGTPLRDTFLAITRYSIFGSGEKLDTRTDSAGRFFMEVDRLGFFGGSLEVTANLEDGDAPLAGRVSYQGGGDAGLQFRGDVILRSEGPLAAGVVIDEQGNPVEGAWVFAGPEAQFDDLWMRRGPEPVQGTTDRGGQFVLRGKRLGATQQVWASKGSSRAGPIETEVGASNLRLELRPLCVVRGHIVLDEGVPMNLQVALEQDGRHISGTQFMDSEGDFSMTPAEGGTYVLLCRAGQSVLYESGDLLLEGDLDVGDIDLSGAFTRHEIVLLGLADDDVEGELRWKPAGAQALESEAGEAVELWTDVDVATTTSVFWTTSPSVDVELLVHGFRKAVLPAVTGRREVELAAPLQVRLVLDTDGPIPAPPYIFDPELHADGLRVGNPIGSRFFTDAKREVEFRVATPGRVRVTWHLERRADNMAVGGGVLSGHEVEIDVLDAVGVQVFRLPLDGEALRKLVESPPF